MTVASTLVAEDDHDDNNSSSNNNIEATAVQDDSNKIVAHAMAMPRYPAMKWILVGVLFFLACTAIAVVVPLVFVNQRKQKTAIATPVPTLAPSSLNTMVTFTYLQWGNTIWGNAPREAFGTSVALSYDGTIMASGAYLSNNQDNTTTLINEESLSKIKETTNGISWVKNCLDKTLIPISDMRWRFRETVASWPWEPFRIIIPCEAPDNAGRVHVHFFNTVSRNWQAALGGDLHGDVVGDHFGAAISMDGQESLMAIGAPQLDANDAIGYVRLYRNNSTAGTFWAPLESLSLRGEASGDTFGFSVSLSDDGMTLAVGAPGAEGDTGQVRIFCFVDNTNNIIMPLGQALRGDSTGSLFVWSVSVNSDGSCVAVGAPQPQAEGRAFVSCWNGTSWGQKGLQRLSGAVPRDLFGTSVSLTSSSDTALRLVVGVPGRDVDG